MRRRDDRPELGLGIQGLADLHRFGLRDERLGEALDHRSLDEDPGPADADLAGVPEGPEGAPEDGRVEVGVGEDEVRVLATELERDALDLRGRDLEDP